MSKNFSTKVTFSHAITWGAASGPNIECLNKLQKRAASIILRANYDTPSVDMFKELGWLSVPDRLKYNNALLTYRAINNILPEYISNILKTMSVAHTLNIQSSANGSMRVHFLFCTKDMECSSPTVETKGSLSTFTCLF